MIQLDEGSVFQFAVEAAPMAGVAGGAALLFDAVEDGVTVAVDQNFLDDLDVAAFFAAEVAKYGAELDGILYMFTAPGAVEVSYPAGVSTDVISAYVDGFVSDLLSYVEGFDIQPATV